MFQFGLSRITYVVVIDCMQGVTSSLGKPIPVHFLIVWHSQIVHLKAYCYKWQIWPKGKNQQKDEEKKKKKSLHNNDKSMVKHAS